MKTILLDGFTEPSEEAAAAHAVRDTELPFVSAGSGFFGERWADRFNDEIANMNRVDYLTTVLLETRILSI